MDIALIEKHFSRIGARIRVAEPERNRRWRRQAGFGIDIRTDRRGEYFALEVPETERVELLPLEVRPEMRHLLLLVQNREDGIVKASKEKYLCGHDERHWFVARVPEASATTVKMAMAYLRPGGLEPELNRRVRQKDRLRRRNAVFVRQGEWFFIPEPDFVAPATLILRHEPISRGDGGKPHWCEELCRHGGSTVYVCSRHPRGIDTAAYHKLLERKPEAKAWNWRVMQRDARVYARGRISHPDHKTIVLPFWHQVLMNGEHRRGVVFLD